MMFFLRLFNKIALKSSTFKPNLRCLASSPAQDKLVTVDLNEKTGMAILKFNRPPVNALNMALLKALTEAILCMVEDNECQSLILTSSVNRIFSAGLDLKELYQPDEKRLKQFIKAFQESWLALYGCNAITVALINGHAPAGGCVFATCCDYRVMLPNFSIGLNETQLGLVPPNSVITSCCNVLPRRLAEVALTQGKLFQSEEALKIGLVDEIAKDKDQAMHKCIEFLSNYKTVNSEARALTKKQFRKSDIDKFLMERETELRMFVKRILTSEFQQQLGEYIENLKKK